MFWGARHKSGDLLKSPAKRQYLSVRGTSDNTASFPAALPGRGLPPRGSRTREIRGENASGRGWVRAVSHFYVAHPMFWGSPQGGCQMAMSGGMTCVRRTTNSVNPSVDSTVPTATSARPLASRQVRKTVHSAYPGCGYWLSASRESRLKIGTLSINVWRCPWASTNSQATTPAWHSSTNRTVWTARSQSCCTLLLISRPLHGPRHFADGSRLVGV
jgi:hypothetical protein